MDLVILRALGILAIACMPGGIIALVIVKLWRFIPLIPRWTHRSVRDAAGNLVELVRLDDTTWHVEARRCHPIRYFLTETVPRRIVAVRSRIWTSKDPHA